ncbi:MAG: hypothetical protein IRZ16_23110 [Myxococcaceae bacterium]|nr:hypothetical protein [Myxococcaceae bacterium]
MRSLPFLRAVGAIAAMATVAGCATASSSGPASPELAAARKAKISVIAVYPFGFRWDEPAYRSFELSGRLIQLVLDRSKHQVHVFGPGEFGLFRPDDDNVYAASTLATLLGGIGKTPGEVVVLRPWAERRTESSSRTLVDAHGKAVGHQRSEEVTYVGHVEVIHAATRQRLVELTREVVADPFAIRDDDGADPTPELTALMEALTDEALSALEPQLVLAGTFARVPGLSLDVTPELAFAYSEPGRPALDATLVKMDPLDRELFVTARARFLNPQLRPDDAAKLASRPGGLHVHVPAPGAPLHPGDVITQVNGGPAYPQALVRARLLPGPDTLKVRRASGDYEVVELP